MKRTAMIVSLAVLIPAAIVASVLGWRYLDAERKYQSNVDVLRQHGDIVDIGEFYQVYTRKEKDSTPLYEQAASQVSPGLNDEIRKLRNWDPKSSPAVVEYIVRTYEPVYKLLDQALSMDRPFYQREFDTGYIAPETPQYEAFLTFGRLLATRARSAIMKHDVDAAIADLKKIDALAQHAGGEPMTSASQVSYAIESQGLWNHLATEFIDDRPALQKLLEHFSSRPPLVHFTYSQMGTAANARHTLQDTEQLSRYIDEFINNNEIPAASIEKTKLMSPPVRRAAERIAVRRAAEMWRGFDRLGKAPNYLDVMDMLLQHDLEMNDDLSPSGILNRMTFITGAHGIQDYYAALARRRQVIIGCHLALARNATGKWPDKLPDLGEVTDDPFSEGKVVYKLTKPGYVLYSVGPDMKDDGGAELTQEFTGDLRTIIKWD